MSCTCHDSLFMLFQERHKRRNGFCFKSEKQLNILNRDFFSWHIFICGNVCKCKFLTMCVAKNTKAFSYEFLTTFLTFILISKRVVVWWPFFLHKTNICNRKLSKIVNCYYCFEFLTDFMTETSTMRCSAEYIRFNCFITFLMSNLRVVNFNCGWFTYKCSSIACSVATSAFECTHFIFTVE